MQCGIVKNQDLLKNEKTSGLRRKLGIKTLLIKIQMIGDIML